MPVKLILVKLEANEYPVLAVTPAGAENLKVAPEGGFTKPTVTNKLVVGTNPVTEKPAALWFEVF